ncbi:DUF3304 domain-containing protein [Providencia rettgeri]
MNQFLTRYRKWILRTVLMVFLGWASWFTWLVIWGPPQGGVVLVIHTLIDRPIGGFSVNGVAGGNAGAYDPNPIYTGTSGKTTCCGVINGNEAKVIWTVDYTQKQYDSGIRTEIHEKILPLPKRKRGENYLHVYFLPNDVVKLWWGEGLSNPWINGMSQEERIAALAQY